MTAVEMDPVTHDVIAHQLPHGVTMAEVMTAIVREMDGARGVFTNDPSVRTRMTGVREIKPHGQCSPPIRVPSMIGRLEDVKDAVGVLRLTFRELEIGAHAVLNHVNGGLRVVLGKRLPDSIIGAAVGRPLSHVASHRALDDNKLTISHAYNLPTGLSFNIRGGRRSMGAAFVVEPIGTKCVRVDPIGANRSRMP